MLCDACAQLLSSADFGSGDGNGSGGSILPADVPTLLAGDFNSLASKRVPDVFDPQIPPGGMSSGVYTLLASGALPPTHPEHPFTRRGGAVGEGAAFAKVPLTTAGLSLVSAHAAALGHEPPLTTKTATFAGCLDFVWASAAHWRVCRVLAMPYAMPRMRADAAAAAVAAAAAAATRPGVCSDSGHGSGSGVPGADDLVWMDPRADVEFPAIPDEHFPSDHLAVGAVLELVPPAWAAGPGA
mmetsp:Transcript_20484/g.61042  ORF Transcript_20484/g.61042 Transcript_20484/m.61042 type:complete len:241 (+) Transcript_20484:382-1104(+)